MGSWSALAVALPKALSVELNGTLEGALVSAVDLAIGTCWLGARHLLPLQAARTAHAPIAASNVLGSTLGKMDELSS